MTIKFGKYEMELAAERITQAITKQGSPDISLTALDFNDDEQTLRGFECLIGYGWLQFRPTGGPEGSCQEDYTPTPQFLTKTHLQKQPLKRHHTHQKPQPRQQRQPRPSHH